MGSNDRHLRLRIQNSDTPHNEKKLKRLYFFYRKLDKKRETLGNNVATKCFKGFFIITILLSLTVYQGEREVRRVKTI